MDTLQENFIDVTLRSTQGTALNFGGSLLLELMKTVNKTTSGNQANLILEQWK